MCKIDNKIRMQTLVIPTKLETLDAFSFNLQTHRTYSKSVESLFCLTESPRFSASLLKKDDNINSIIGADIDKMFMLGLFSYCYIKHLNDSTDTFTVSFSELKAYLGLSSGGKSFDIKRAVSRLEKVFGVCVSHFCNPIVSEIVFSEKGFSFTSSYFNILIRFMRYGEDGKRGSFYTSLVRSTIVKCRNSSAAEIVVALCSLIARRGISCGGTSHITLRTLLTYTPQLTYRLQTAPDYRKNTILRQSLEKAQEYITDYTLISEVYKDYKILLPEQIKVDNLEKVIKIHIKGQKEAKYGK